MISASSRISIGATILLLVLESAASAQRQSSSATVLQSKKELVAAIGSKQITEIIAASDIGDLEEIRLLPGQSLRSDHERRATLTFLPDVDGVELTSDNSLTGLDVRVSPTKRAIWNDRSVDGMGRMTIQSVEAIGGFRSSRQTEFEAGELR